MRPLTIHKPNSSKSGSAGKFNVRLEEVLGTKSTEQGGGTYWKRTKGGLFVDLAKQLPTDDAHGNSTFGWTPEQQLITAKLGLPDLSGLLLAYQSVRVLGKAVPAELRPKVRGEATPEQLAKCAASVSLFHKPEQGGSTVIGYEFTAQGGRLEVSKSRDLRRTLNLGLAEEYRVFRFFDLALDELLKAGAR